MDMKAETPPETPAESVPEGAEGDTSGAMKRPTVDWPRLAAMAICVGAAILLLWIFMTCALGILLPFLIAWGVSLILRPVVQKLTAGHRKWRGPVAAGAVLLLTGLVGWLTVLGTRRAVMELEHLILRLGGAGGEENASGVAETLATVMDWVNSLSEHIPLIRHFEEKPGFAQFCAWLDTSARTAVAELVNTISGKLSAAAVGMVKGLPSLLVFTAVLLLACYYFSADDGRVRQGLSSLLPARMREGLPGLQARLKWFCRRYLRAYLLLMLITFAEMFIGLSILRTPYAFLLAIVIAVVDLLPVLGTGTVLLPWALLAFITREPSTGFGLLILYGVSVIVRQIAEPRLLGATLGLHPLLSLATMYAGLRLFGLPGMLLSPLFALAIKEMCRRGDPAGGEEIQP